jgi:hypothetical protein
MSPPRAKERQVKPGGKVMRVNKIPSGDAVPLVKLVEKQIKIFSSGGEFGKGDMSYE